MSDFQKRFIKLLQEEGYKPCISYFQDKLTYDRVFKKDIDNMLSVAIKAKGLNTRFEFSSNNIPSSKTIEQMGIKMTGCIFFPIEIKFKDIIAGYILYLNRLANQEVIKYYTYEEGNKICEFIKEYTNTETYNYIIDISNYYFENKEYLRILDKY